MSIVDSSQVGGASFVQTLQMLANPEEVQRRFQALVEQQAKTEEFLKLVGPANEILAMRQRIELDLEQAKQVLGDARVQAAMLVDTARRKAQEIEQELVAKQQAAEADIAAIRAEEEQAVASTKANMAAANGLKNDYLAKLVEVDNLKAQVEKERDELRGARVAFENRLQAATDIVEQFRSALGAL
jgi:hypothetical protein